MEHDATNPKKNKVKKLTKKCNSESAKADQSGMENTYGIDHLTICEGTHGSDESK